MRRLALCRPTQYVRPVQRPNYYPLLAQPRILEAVEHAQTFTSGAPVSTREVRLSIYAAPDNPPRPNFTSVPTMKAVAHTLTAVSRLPPDALGRTLLPCGRSSKGHMWGIKRV